MGAEQDQKDYQDYVAYQQYLQSQSKPQGSVQEETRKFMHGEDSPAWNQMSRDAMGMAAGSAANTAASAAPALKSFLGRVSTGTGLGAASGAVRSPGEGESRLGNATKGAAVGAGVSLAGEGVNAGANKLADWLQLGATGSKGTPGEGNRLVDMGIRGSRSTMSDQVSDAFQGKEQGLQDLVQSTPGTEPSSNMADYIRQQNMPRFQLSGGKTNTNVQPEMNQIRDFSQNVQDIAPEFTAKDLLDLKRQGDWPGYTNAGTKAGTLEGMMGRSQGDFSRTTLDRMTSGKSSDMLGDEQALVNAGKSLGKEYREGLVPSLITAKTGIPRSITRGVMSQVGAPIESYSAAGLQNGVAPVASELGRGLPLGMAVNASLFNKDKR